MTDLFDMTKNLVFHEVRFPLWFIFIGFFCTVISSFGMFLLLRHKK